MEFSGVIVMPQKLTILFSYTSVPVNAQNAQPRSAGWSESHWNNSTLPINSPFITNLITRRAPLLPKQANITGVRVQQFTIAGNKLLPGRSASASILLPGNNAYNANSPTDCMMAAFTANGTPNGGRFSMKCIPDEVVVQGEYNGDAAYNLLLANYYTRLIQDAWGFVGRDLTQPSSRVLAVTLGGQVTLAANVGGAQGQDFLRFHRVKDENGVAVKGSFVANTIAGAVYTLGGYNGQIVTSPSGLARIDKLVYLNYGTITTSRTVGRKVGRPFILYRGRASRRSQ
jgi:hypothetical protein